MEASTVLHYAVGQTIGHHYDFVDPAHPGYAEEVRTRGHRVVTFLIYLNAGYEGGETIFPRIGVRHVGQRGEGLLFVNTLPDGQANLRTLHSGEPPTRGGSGCLAVRSRPAGAGRGLTTRRFVAGAPRSSLLSLLVYFVR